MEVVAEIINRYTDERWFLAKATTEYLVKVETCGLCAGAQNRYPDVPAICRAPWMSCCFG